MKLFDLHSLDHNAGMRYYEIYEVKSKEAELHHVLRVISGTIKINELRACMNFFVCTKEGHVTE